MPEIPRSTPKDLKSGRATSEQDFWRLCESFRPQLAIAGFWQAFQENCNQWADEVTICPFWKALKEKQPSWSNDFRQKTSGALLASPAVPGFFSKSVPRIKEKMYRDWLREKSPEDVISSFIASGAPVPKVKDIVRTRIECQFLDGVEFLAGCLEKLASELGLEFARERQGRLQGYFAQHFCFEASVIFRFGGGQQIATIDCEVQIATALATRIWEESHRTYEEWRVKTDEAEEWQWNPSDPRFTARQLGHMIHLADGLLVQLRNSANQRN